MIALRTRSRSLVGGATKLASSVTGSSLDTTACPTAWNLSSRSHSMLVSASARFSAQ